MQVGYGLGVGHHGSVKSSRLRDREELLAPLGFGWDVLSVFTAPQQPHYLLQAAVGLVRGVACQSHGLAGGGGGGASAPLLGLACSKA